MCKLLEHTINNGDRRLSDIIVKGERCVDHETGIFHLYFITSDVLLAISKNNSQLILMIACIIDIYTKYVFPQRLELDRKLQNVSLINLLDQLSHIV